MTKHKTHFPPKSPKQCPCGHKHFSWSIGEKEVFCWDCNRNYPLSECFGPSAVGARAKIEKEEKPDE